MNIHELLLESRNYHLYEGLTSSEKHSVMLWESAGYAIKEAALTADQIQQIFTSIEQGATAAGSNRTVLGKGKDAAGAVKAAYDDLVSKVQNSGPIKNIDAKYDQAAEKLKQATGSDAGVMKYIEKYRTFAKKHPVSQGLIYSALIAAAGISGVGIGGAAALGLLKMTDKLLQGEKFSTAVGKGVATGALAFGASKIADLFPGSDVAAGGPTVGLSDEQIAFLKQAGADGSKMVVRGGDLWIDAGNGLQMLSAPSGSSAEQMLKIAQSGVKSAAESIQYNSKKLSEGQVYLVFNRVCATQLDEGVFDKIKTIGKNLTTKVTADKLNSAWQKAGAPTDSNELAAFLKTQGVGDDVIANTYQSMKMPAPGAAPATEPAVEKQSKLGIGQINKILPTLRTRDLLSIQKTVVNTIAGKQKANI